MRFLSFLSFFYNQITLSEQEETYVKRFLLIQIHDCRIIKDLSCLKQFHHHTKAIPYHIHTSPPLPAFELHNNTPLKNPSFYPSTRAQHITAPTPPHQPCRHPTTTLADPPINPPVTAAQSKNIPSAYPPPISPTATDFSTRAILHTHTETRIRGLRNGGRSLRG